MINLVNQGRKFPGVPISGRILRRFSGLLKTIHAIDPSKLIEFYMDLYSRKASSRGLLDASKRMKDYYNLSLRLASGQKLYNLPYVATDRYNYPKELMPFRSYLLSGDTHKVQLGLSVLSIWRLVKVEGPCSFSTITEPGLVPQSLSGERHQLGDYFRKVGPKLGLTEQETAKLIYVWNYVLEEAFPIKDQQARIKELTKLARLHVSSKNGPNGPAIATAVVDLSVIPSDIMESIKQLAKITLNKPLTKLISSIQPKVYEGAKHSKISLKVEAGGKIRPFAICDWWSQSALTPIHSWIFGWLSKQPEDGTMSHNRVASIAKEFTKQPIIGSQENIVISSDLTAATDRIPRDLQREIIQYLFGDEVSKLWTNVVSERDFVTPSGSSVRYAVGQPMGILSSWACLAVWHHLTARSASYLAGQPWKGGTYLIIGDDVLIKGTDRSRWYQYLVSQIMGVPISKEKSFDPTQPHPLTNKDQRLHSCELAKRVFVNGVEITPIPPDAIQMGLENPSGFPSLLQMISDRDWYNPSFEGPAPALASLSDKPRLACIYATFPCAPAPNYVGVTEVFKGLNAPVGERSLGCDFVSPWWSFPYKDIETIYVTALRRRMVDAFKASVAMAKRFKSLGTEAGTMKVSRWQIWREDLGKLLEEVALQGKSVLDKTFGGAMLRPLPLKELKPLIGKHHVYIDLKLVLLGRTNFMDEKKRSANFLSRVQKEVLRKLESS